MSRPRPSACLAGALLLVACEPSSRTAPAGSATASAVTASASAAAPSGERLPANAAIRFHWFAYASKSREPHKLWLEPSHPRDGAKLLLTYTPDAGASPPRQEVPAAAREALAKALEASRLGAWKIGAPKPGADARWNYVLSVSWPREGQPPALHTVSWTDATETPELGAVRRAMLDLGIAKFPAVARAAEGQ